MDDHALYTNILAPLADNAGPGLTYELLPASTALYSAQAGCASVDQLVWRVTLSAAIAGRWSTCPRS